MSIALRDREAQAGFLRLDYLHAASASTSGRTKRRLLEFLIDAKQRGQAASSPTARPGKGNTLLNYCGIRTDFLDYTVDRNPYKHGQVHAGHAHPDLPARAHRRDAPDYVLILPWNLKDEIIAQMAYIREWGGQFVVPIPQRSGPPVGLESGPQVAKKPVPPKTFFCRQVDS